MSAPAPAVCIVCKQAPAAEYFLLGGARPICAPCRARVEASLVPTTPLGPALGGAAALGIDFSRP